MAHRIFTTREEAEAHLETLITPAAVEAQKVKQAAAAASIAAERESFERCDTDGFVSQWCHSLSSVKSEREAEVALHGGCAAFQCLVDAETGELRSTKRYILPNRFAGYGSVTKWCVPGPDGKAQWITDFVKESSFAKKGLKTAFIVAPAYVSYENPLNRMPVARGFSGLHAVRSMVLLDYRNSEVKL
jgi:hypothetical protein